MRHVTLLIVIVLASSVRVGAQQVVPYPIGRYAITDCPLVGAVEPTAEVPNGGLLRRVRALASQLPSGVEQRVAQALVAELDTGSLTSFCRDIETGDLVASYSVAGGATGVVVEGRTVELRVQPENRSRPDIEFDVSRLSDSRSFQYAYRISNESNATSPIKTWGILSAVGDQSIRLNHPMWTAPDAALGVGALGSVSETRTDTNDATADLVLTTASGPLVQWSAPTDQHRIRAGSSLSGFSITSQFLPGLTTAYVGSAGGVTRTADTMPDDVKHELSILLEPQNHYTAILTVGPKFDSRVESAWIAGDWSVGIRMMVDKGTLSRDPDYVIELLRSLELIAQSASSVEFTVVREPAAGIESLLDKILNMVL